MMSARENTNNINNDISEDFSQSPELLERDEEMNMDDEDNEEDEDEEGMNSDHARNNWTHWISELPSKVKDQLIYTRTPNSDNHIFWVDIYDRTVSFVKKELSKMRRQYQKILRSGKANEIASLKKEIQEKEDLFVKRHFNKVEYDRTLPMTEPMEPRLRKALYYVKSSEVTYNIKRCPEQIEMLLDLKARKRIFTRMVRVKNMHAPSVVNELYHKEFEYQKQFLTIKNEEEIQSAIKKRQEMPKKLSKKQIKRMKQMAKKLDKANASFGNKNTTHVQNPNTLNRYKQPSQTNTNWRQNQPERQPRNVNQFQQSNNAGNGQMNVQTWGQQQMQSRNNEDYSQYYGYNQSNFPSQPQWGQPNSNWNQTPTPGNNFRNQGGNFNQSWNNRGNQPQYNNSSYNQNTFERNDRFKQNSRHTKPHGYQPY
uniref:Uncharacterized protein n=1 Tax=Cacopsylla melanoneura TaxID=428564 RepID=A0A8D9A914_9HEMI